MLLIFDWDGTLSDSTGKITAAMQMAARELGWPEPEASEVHNIIGLGLPEAIRLLYPQRRNATELEQFRRAYSRQFVAADQQQPSDFFPGVLDTLHRLREQGHVLTVATGKSRRGLDRVLEALGMSGFFHATRCADETASKPDPLMLQQLLVEFRMPVEEAAMIGDTEYDMDMARRIHMPRIAVSYGAHHIDRLRPYEPELCLDEFTHLWEWERL